MNQRSYLKPNPENIDGNVFTNICEKSGLFFWTCSWVLARAAKQVMIGNCFIVRGCHLLLLVTSPSFISPGETSFHTPACLPQSLCMAARTRVYFAPDNFILLVQRKYISSCGSETKVCIQTIAYSSVIVVCAFFVSKLLRKWCHLDIAKKTKDSDLMYWEVHYACWCWLLMVFFKCPQNQLLLTWGVDIYDLF